MTSPTEPKTASTGESKKTTSVRVIHIPTNGPISPVELSTIHLDHKSLNGYLRKETQSRLEQVPDVKGYVEQGVFDWDRRGLFDMVIPKERVPEGSGWEGCYIVYKCDSSDSVLPFNRTFVGIRDARIFGDAFLFRLNGPECDQSGKATFRDLGPEFVQSAKDGGFAIQILDSMSKATHV